MNFKLRPWDLNDVESLVKYAGNYNIAKYMTNRFAHPYSREDGENFIKMAMEQNPTQIFAIEINGEACGGIGLHLQDDIYLKNAELGYWLGEPHWGKGVITKAINQMVEYGFDTFDINRIFARPFGSNIGSQRVLEKVGFILEASLEKTLFKNGKYLDELVYAIRK